MRNGITAAVLISLFILAMPSKADEAPTAEPVDEVNIWCHPMTCRDRAKPTPRPVVDSAYMWLDRVKRGIR